MLGYLLYRLGEIFAWLLGRRGAYWLACCCADIRLFFSTGNRNIIRSNLSVVFQEDPPYQIHKRIRAVFRTFAKSISDFMRMREINKEFIRRHVKIEGLEHVQRGLKGGKGVLLVSSHVGTWELGAAILSMLGYRVNVVALAHSEKQVNRYFIKKRGLKGVRVINAHFALRRCLELLRKNEIVAILGDKDFTKQQGITVNFFNRPTDFPKGPSALALKTGAALIPTFNVRTEGENYKLVMSPSIAHPAESLDKNVMQNITQRFASILESMVRRYPDQWTLFLPMWGSEKTGQAA
jgi:lauroyl/myristoyl acyltransferase